MIVVPRISPAHWAHQSASRRRRTVVLSSCFLLYLAIPQQPMPSSSLRAPSTRYRPCFSQRVVVLSSPIRVPRATVVPVVMAPGCGLLEPCVVSQTLLLPVRHSHTALDQTHSAQATMFFLMAHTAPPMRQCRARVVSATKPAASPSIVLSASPTYLLMIFHVPLLGVNAFERA
jgi:hypothetical protein